MMVKIIIIILMVIIITITIVEGLMIVISNGNRTEWSTIQGVIGRVISNQPGA